MEKLIVCIEKNQLEEFIERLNKKLEEPSFIDRTFRRPDQKYSTSWTHNLFSYACMHGRLEICKYLLSKGADPIGKKSGAVEGFPLAISVLHNQFHVADWLQKKFNIDCSINDSWVLEILAEYGNLDGIKYALKHGADIHAANENALQFAVIRNHLDIVEYLLEQGADIHVNNDEALRRAMWSNFFEVVECLLEHGADPNVKNENGYLLQWLVDKDQLDLAAKAVSYGADLSVLSPAQRQKFGSRIVSKKMSRPRKL